MRVWFTLYPLWLQFPYRSCSPWDTDALRIQKIRFQQDLLKITPKAEINYKSAVSRYSAMSTCMMSQADLVIEVPGPKMAATPA